ncbi:hypothetical protein PROFUN_08605 [Planoprotostelium fungivorum]|uniref:EF-hand domain-containing protein n=1 Tax=Planoprotostelium fungivorum TaxID=1890364 RepID=A0A2P6NJ69_9EUKA|nr:hypothetical protein PROFUN_08605 [Planoprotostelium fungivorum]
MPPVSRLVFNKYDTDKTGTLDRKEFKELCYSSGHFLSDRELDSAIAVIDRSGDGKISYDEFVSWWSSNSRWGRVELSTEQMATLERCSKYFMYFDKDRSGSLDRNEFSKLHADIKKHFPQKLGTLDSAIAKLDSNGDGIIQFGEYLDWLQIEGVMNLKN